MYQRIKQLADEAVALQNKLRMEAALREISAICDVEVIPPEKAPKAMDAEQFEAAELAQHQAARGRMVEVAAGERLEKGDPVVIVKGAAKKAAKK